MVRELRSRKDGYNCLREPRCENRNGGAACQANLQLLARAGQGKKLQKDSHLAFSFPLSSWCPYDAASAGFLAQFAFIVFFAGGETKRQCRPFPTPSLAHARGIRMWAPLKVRERGRERERKRVASINPPRLQANSLPSSPSSNWIVSMIDSVGEIFFLCIHELVYHHLSCATQISPASECCLAHYTNLGPWLFAN